LKFEEEAQSSFINNVKSENNCGEDIFLEVDLGTSPPGSRGRPW